MRSILVTGGTGTLGRPTVERLRAAGHDVRVLSRKSGPGVVTGDLSSGQGLRAAVEGVDTVLHLATSNRRADVRLAVNLLETAREAAVDHLILISIVGLDQIPLPYYRDKLEVERLVMESPIPFSILRATQFHNLLDRLMSAQKLLPCLLAPAVKLQPIAVEEVAARLAEIASGPPSGRLPDIGGPEQLALPELARSWKRARGSRRPVAPVRLPGKIFRGYASGAACVPGPPYGHTTFTDFLADQYGVTA
jgi:uncharacterized protein YbjT (DUF2867 family)